MSSDEGPYEGSHYRLGETICLPQPVQRPRPKILIGGGGERKTLRLVARYADACNLVGTSPEEIRHKLQVLERHCADVDRDPSTIQKTILATADPFSDPDGFLSSMEEYAALGIDLVGVMPRGPDPAGAVRGLATTVIPRLAELGASA